MKKIRQNVFETNSSSTHSFTIVDGDYQIYSPIEPNWDSEFGWGFETWSSPEDKLAYIIRCIISYDYCCSNDAERRYLGENDSDEINQNLINILTPIQQRLHNLGIDFEIPTYSDIEKGYVDHSDWYKSDIEEIINTDDGLLNFIFNYNCEINGGNDNC